jgi:glycosyltransferase involved in cell wall biosynthesis
VSKVLYLSYDGMCDPLGGSQVLPYLSGLARRGHDIALISLEKSQRSAEDRAVVQRACDDLGISWHPLIYHKRPPVLSGMWDVRNMHRLAARLHKHKHFDLVHCRSYLAALVGLRMKRRLGVPFIFDMRGFWAEERVEGGLWKLSNPLFRTVYDYFKRREAEFLSEADHIVSLTEAGKRILLERRAEPSDGPPITVIPCCVDFDAFPAITEAAGAAARRLLGISPGTRVVTYLGSFGTWYLADEMFGFFRVQLERDAGAMFLIVSPQPADEILAVAAGQGIPADRIVVRHASRREVPKLLAAADYGMFFIMPVFSKKASSPTKMGEMLALELPVITNDGVGDVTRIVAESGAGVVVDRFDDKAYRKALDELERLKPDMARWRTAARNWFDLDQGVERYDAIYRAITKSRDSPNISSPGTR